MGYLVFKYLACVREGNTKSLLDKDIFFSVVKNRQKRVKRGGWNKEQCYETCHHSEVGHLSKRTLPTAPSSRETPKPRTCLLTQAPQVRTLYVAQLGQTAQLRNYGSVIFPFTFHSLTNTNLQLIFDCVWWACVCVCARVCVHARVCVCILQQHKHRKHHILTK